MKPLSHYDLSTFILRFRQLVISGHSPESALSRIAEASADSRFSGVLLGAAAAMRNGESLAEALFPETGHPFPPFLRRILKAAEADGKALELALDGANEYIAISSGTDASQEYAVKLMQIAAPAVILLFFFILVVPPFSNMYTESGMKLPFLTAICLAISKFTIKYIIIIMAAVAIGFRYIIKRWQRTPGDIDRAVSLAQLAGRIAQGHTVADALTFAAETASHGQFGEMLKKAGASVANGSTLSEALLQFGVISPFASSLLQSGEQGISIAGRLAAAAQHYVRRARLAAAWQRQTGTVSVFFCVVLSVLIMISLYLPIFKMAGSVSETDTSGNTGIVIGFALFSVAVYSGIMFFRRQKECAEFLPGLNELLGAGVQLPDALEAMAGISPLLGKNLNRAAGALRNGATLADCCQAHLKKLSGRIRSQLVHGEREGLLREFIAISEPAGAMKKTEIWSAFALLFVCMLLVSLILIFVIPTFSKLFYDFGGQLPLLTRIVIFSSNFMIKYIVIIILALYLTRYFAKNSKIGYLFPPIHFRYAMLMATATNMLLLNGRHLSDAIGISAELTASRLIKKGSMALVKLMQNGADPFDTIMQERLLPEEYRIFLATLLTPEAAETSSQILLDCMNERLSSELAAFNEKVKLVFTFVVSVTVGLIVIAMYLPIFMLSSGV